MPTRSLDELIDFGPAVPVAISPEARLCLERLPRPAIESIMAALRRWAEGIPLTGARATIFDDPEVDDWREVIVELRVDCNTDTSLALWDQMAEQLDNAEAFLSAEDKAQLARGLDIQLSWGADGWDDERAAV